MKKIICLLLALTCVFALISCGDEELAAFNAIVENSKPTQIITQTTRIEDGRTLSGTFKTKINGEEYTLEYTYQRYALPADAFDEAVVVDENGIATVAGTIYYKNGLFSEDGENWTSVAPDSAVLNVTLNLAEDSLGAYTIKNNKLTTNITAEQAKVVLGLDLSTSGDISLTVNNTSAYISTLSVEYTAAPLTEGAEGARVSIETSYSYTTNVEAAE